MGSGLSLTKSFRACYFGIVRIFDENGKTAVLKEIFLSGNHLDGMKTSQMHETVVGQKLKSTECATINPMS